MFTVEISKLKVRTKIGVSITERIKPQLLLVTLKFSYKVNTNKNINNIANLKNKVRFITKRNRTWSIKFIIKMLNRVIRGWFHYFKIASAKMSGPKRSYSNKELCVI